MDRIATLRNYIDEVLLNMEDAEERRCAYLHLYVVSQACAMIAKKRNSDAELATMAGMLHDLYSYKKMNTKSHAHFGSDLAREVLKELDITNKKETDLICSAIYNHSDKKNVHEELDEILKDADVLQHCLYNVNLPIKKKQEARYDNLMMEFGVS